jgi:archaellum component FlaD/FlaE
MGFLVGDRVKFIGDKTDHGRGDWEDVLEKDDVATIDEIHYDEEENWATIGDWDYAFNELELVNNKELSTDKQVGGSWYKDLNIQPVEFVMENEDSLHPTDSMAINVVLKYLVRHRNRNGAEDLEKAIHYIEMVKEHSYD